MHLLILALLALTTLSLQAAAPPAPAKPKLKSIVQVTDNEPKTIAETQIARWTVSLPVGYTIDFDKMTIDGKATWTGFNEIDNSPAIGAQIYELEFTPTAKGKVTVKLPIKSFNNEDQPQTITFTVK
ncbi:hypothetical protein [Lacunimicrobium album]